MLFGLKNTVISNEEIQRSMGGKIVNYVLIVISELNFIALIYEKILKLYAKVYF